MEPSSESGLGDLQTLSFRNLTIPEAIYALQRLIAANVIGFEKQTGLKVVSIGGPYRSLNNREAALDVNDAISISVATPRPCKTP